MPSANGRVGRAGWPRADRIRTFTTGTSCTPSRPVWAVAARRMKIVEPSLWKIRARVDKRARSMAYTRDSRKPKGIKRTTPGSAPDVVGQQHGDALTHDVCVLLLQC